MFVDFVSFEIMCYKVLCKFNVCVELCLIVFYVVKDVEEIIAAFER